MVVDAGQDLEREAWLLLGEGPGEGRSADLVVAPVDGCDGAARLVEEGGGRLAEDDVVEGALVAGPSVADAVDRHGSWHGADGERSQHGGHGPMAAHHFAEEAAPTVTSGGPPGHRAEATDLGERSGPIGPGRGTR